MTAPPGIDMESNCSQKKKSKYDSKRTDGLVVAPLTVGCFLRLTNAELSLAF